MKLLIHFKILAFIFALIQSSYSGAMDSIRVVVGRGHQGIVYDASPIRLNFQALVEQIEIPAVTKELESFSMGDLTVEAQTQIAIRKGLNESFAHLARHIPIIESFDRNTITMQKASGFQLDVLLFGLELHDFLPLMNKIMILIEAIHQLGYSHEDISPQNIIVNVNNINDFILIDFELAGPLGSRRKSTGAAGFSAPEKLSSLIMDPKADVYSLGKILEAYFCFHDVNDQIDYLIDAMIEEDPLKRKGLCEALIMMQNIISNLSPKNSFRIISNCDGKTGCGALPVIGYASLLPAET